MILTLKNVHEWYNLLTIQQKDYKKIKSVYYISAFFEEFMLIYRYECDHKSTNMKELDKETKILFISILLYVLNKYKDIVTDIYFDDSPIENNTKYNVDAINNLKKNYLKFFTEYTKRATEIYDELEKNTDYEINVP